MAEKKIGGCIIEFSKNFDSKKKISLKMRQNHGKVDFRQIFHNKLYFFMSNLNLECSQLSFDVHIVHIDQKIEKVRFSPMIFSRSD